MVSKLPSDEIEVGAEIVRKLVDSQFPQHAKLPVKRMGAFGSTNVQLSTLPMFWLHFATSTSAQKRDLIGCSEATIEGEHWQSMTARCANVLRDAELSKGSILISTRPSLCGNARWNYQVHPQASARNTTGFTAILSRKTSC